METRAHLESTRKRALRLEKADQAVVRSSKRDDLSKGHSREDAEKRPMSPQNKPFDRLAFVYDAANDVAEGINSKIMSIKRRAGGYRNIENFKTAVLFYCGGLDLDPR